MKPQEITSSSDMTKRDLFIAGLPGCGKSYFGDWLAKEHGYLHVDFEKELPVIFRSYKDEIFQFIHYRAPKPLLRKLRKKTLPVVFDWGFPVNCLDIVKLLVCELDPYWFEADIALARASYLQRKTSPPENFEIQIDSINRRKLEINNIFGLQRITTILPDEKKIPPNEILNTILQCRKNLQVNRRLPDFAETKSIGC